MTHEPPRAQPWRVRFLDGQAHDIEVRMRSYRLRDAAMAAGGALARWYGRTVIVTNLDTGARVEIRGSGQLHGDVQ